MTTYADTRTTVSETCDSLRHELLIHEADETYVQCVSSFLRDGLQEGAPAIVVACSRRRSAVREALGPDAEHVVFLDRDDVYIRPARTVARFERALNELARPNAPTVRIVGELAGGPDPAEWDRWMDYEAAVSAAYAAHNAWLVCAYDTRETPDHIIDEVLRCHPVHVGDPDSVGPTTYEDPALMLGAGTSSPVATVDGLLDLGVAEDPAAVRAAVAGVMAPAHLPPARAVELLLAVNEAAVNAFTHGGRPVTVRAGTPGGRLVVEIADSGPGLADAVAGWLPPRAGRGAGLWLARQATSRLELIPSAAGCTIRLWQ